MSEGKPGETEALIPIASIVPIAVDLEKLKEILKEVNIDFAMEGSRAYQISVRPEDAANAVRALKDSELANRITFY